MNVKLLHSSDAPDLAKQVQAFLLEHREAEVIPFRGGRGPLKWEWSALVIDRGQKVGP